MHRSSFQAEIVRTELCSDRIYDQHCHTRYEILYVLEGSMHLNLEGRQLYLEAGTGIVIQPLKYHVVTGNNTAYHRLIVFLNPDAIALPIADAFHRQVETLAPFKTRQLSGLFESFAQHLERGDPALTPLLEAILTQAVYALTLEITTVPVAAETKHAGRLQRIVSYIESNLDKELSLGELAQQLYLSESSLCHLFRQEMKISLKQYILQKKMMYAKSLLYQGVSPGEAAIRCGYRNYASFYKIFLKTTGKTPTQINQHLIAQDGQ